MPCEREQDLDEPLLYQDYQENLDFTEVHQSHRKQETRRFHGNGAFLSTAAVICTLLLVWRLREATASHREASELCENGRTPLMRREWRNLTNYELDNYMSALQCLHTSPSQIHPAYSSITRWSDFSWSHYNFGYIAHDAACFLSWHRWFLAVFEHSLRSECGYSGAIPYWDWTLDWQHPERAPVFDVVKGLGGNGNATTTSSADGGWCVTEGLFADSRIPFDFEAVPGNPILHDEPAANDSFCLSRKFSLGDSFNGKHLSPQHVSHVLSKHEYIDFLAALEFGPHNDIPFGINGTFLTLYAPEDPIFWLHHAQLDRLWWIWQYAEPGRARAYNGPSTSNSTAPARLDDRLPFGTLSEDVAVSTIIETQRGRLCYQYDKSSL